MTGRPVRDDGTDAVASAASAASAASGRVGVVVMAYGTPASPDDVEAYYTHIRRGRAPSPEQLANLQMRYDALGGTSTLAARTRDQIDRLTAALEAISPGRFDVVLGQKHAAPFIEDGVASLVAAGVDRIVGLVLAPHYSGFSVGQYHERAGATAADAGVPFVGIERWHDLPEYRAFLADAVRDGLAHLPEPTKVVFTAHSLPERVLAGDPYPDELWESAAAVAEATKLNRWAGWSQAWQSAGATPEPWRGPDVLDVIRDLAATGRAEGILVCPQGFVADHLEVAYDLDIEAALVAAEAGIAFARTRVLNDDPTVLGALARRVAQHADHADHPPGT
ncbi:MAG: ferrochelatase [Acidimicrobiales bacterium]|nr:ferrochelatase [Acidimicrobiales bacterium]